MTPPDAPSVLPARPSSTSLTRGHSRRVVLGSAAWTAPAIVLASAAPAFAASGAPSITVLSTSGNVTPGVGFVDVSLDPDPLVDPTPVVVYDDVPGATTVSFVRTGTSGAAGIFRLQFSTTTKPVPATITATITVTGYGAATAIVTMAAPGTLDTTSADASLNHAAQAVVAQSGGKILVAGNFTQHAGSQQQRLIRLNADGSRDASLPNPFIDQTVYAMAVQSDAKIVVTGNFQSVGNPGVSRKYLARLEADGTLDPTFVDPALNQLGYGVAVQPDGKILVAGYFTTAGGVSRKYLARFEAGGTLDASFQDPALSAFAFAVALQTDGKILVAGDFTTVGGMTRNKLARLNADGTLDESFGDPGLDGRTLALAVQSDGKILASGESTTAGGAVQKYLARFNANGTRDESFVDPGLNARGRGVLVQPDGKIVITGDFTSVGGVARGRLARLTSTGALDTTFANPALSGTEAGVGGIGVARQDDGKIVVVGDFATAGSGASPRKSVARFHG